MTRMLRKCSTYQTHALQIAGPSPAYKAVQIAGPSPAYKAVQIPISHHRFESGSIIV